MRCTLFLLSALALVPAALPAQRVAGSDTSEARAVFERNLAAINHRADNLLALYVVVAATALTLLVRWMWQRRPS